MFLKNYLLYGNHAEKAEELKNKSVITDLFSLLLIAPLYGIKSRRRGEPDQKNEKKTIFAEKIGKHLNEFIFVYRVVIFLHFSDLDTEERINRTMVTETNDPEASQENMVIFDSYLLGGIEKFYEDYYQVESKIPESIYNNNEINIAIVNCLHEIISMQNEESDLDKDIHDLLKETVS